MITNKGRDFYPKTKQQWDNFDHTSLYAIYLHNEHDEYFFIPKGTSPNTNQQNEKPDQKEENENMNRKSEFPVVGQHVLIKNDQDYHLSDFGENVIGLEVTVMSKFTIPSKDEGDISMVAVMADDIEKFGKNICCCFREDMCHPVKTEQEKNIAAWIDLLRECNSIEDVATILVMNGYNKIKPKDKT